MPERSIDHRYEDPVDLIWLRAAEDLGLKIERSSDAFAAYDGKGTLTIANESDFDADDCLAQMIFHEICHWLVAGARGKHLPDWGLSNEDDRDLVYEYAAHRVQAALSAQFGLREFMAVTTDWRPYWDALPVDPLRDGEDPAIAIAQEACHLARLAPFKEVLNRSLTATEAIANAVRDASGPASLWSLTRARHRLGSLLSNCEKSQCGSCAWSVSLDSSDGTNDLVCRQHKPSEATAPVVDAEEQACERWEPKFSSQECGTCGACCREGFDSVNVSDDDPFKKLHPELVQLHNAEHIVPRPDGLCVALDGDGESSLYRCRHYDDRPENCVEFEVGGDNCLLARRRIGLSR